MQATMTSLESSKGWFERALKDAEAAAAVKDEEHEKALEEIRVECKKEIDVSGRVVVIYQLVGGVVRDVTVGAGGLRFDRRTVQIGHSVANNSPPLRCFCVVQALGRGPRHSLLASV